MDTSGPAVIDAISSRKALPTTKRQYRSPESKRQIVEATLAPRASVARVARAHGVNAHQVFAGGVIIGKGCLKPGILPCPGCCGSGVGGGNGPESPKVGPTPYQPTGLIHVELPKGSRGLLDVWCDTKTLQKVLKESLA